MQIVTTPLINSITPSIKSKGHARKSRPLHQLRQQTQPQSTSVMIALLSFQKLSVTPSVLA
jgi:hypothetical protein